MFAQFYPASETPFSSPHLSGLMIPGYRHKIRTLNKQSVTKFEVANIDTKIPG